MSHEFMTMTETAERGALEWAHPVVRAWFVRRFGTATEPQAEGWPAILRGEPVLISAPTGSGKTLAAFLVCIDQLLRKAIAGTLAARTEVVYVSPLKALSNDVQKNLDGPLKEIQELAGEMGYLCPPITTGVRSGDTLVKERVRMLKQPPHILVTTPESLYILLTAGKSRANLTGVRTVIVDEIHALADDKRGTHLALTLERLDALVCGENRLSAGAMLTGMLTPPQRIGLSATQNPIELVGEFLVGAQASAAAPHLHKAEMWGTRQSSVSGSQFPVRRLPVIVQVGQRRRLDLGIEVPSAELGSITSTAMWEEIYDKLAKLTESHRSVLVFVNTRRLVEKISFELAERLGEEVVAAHHGSLSRALRLDAEQRLKAGEVKILVATASLELGIDIGSVDLVCQIASTRAVAVAMQRVGRAGHWRGAVPKGRFFATTRDDLMEQAATVRKMRTGELDRLEIPECATDVLMQQIVAMCGAETWEEDALYRVVTRAWPYRNLQRAEFERTLGLLHEGIESSRGRYGAYVLRDRVQGRVHARRGARSAAIMNGGAIPDTNAFAVMLQPENVQVATLDEHFAVDSSAGDVVLLGNTSWRIQRVDPAGKVLVEDAHGAPPTIPFWEGEAPQRTSVVSDGVGDLREAIAERTAAVTPTMVRASEPAVAACVAWLMDECAVCESAALQMVRYIVEGRAALGAVPTKRRIIAERFFDEGGGQQLILHAPLGGRLNKAWGLALRKRFCRGFNFELQAAATDNGINISLAEQHSFPLADVFHFLSVHTARNLLEQASIPSPLFKNRWKWAAGRSLQLLRMQKGKRVPPLVQRSRSDDLLASVFPHASACPETMTGDIEIPDHPLVNEVMRDTLSEAMDIDGLEALLGGIADGTIECIAVETPVPSVFAHELVNAMPYAYLDEEGVEGRRARGTSLRRSVPDAVTEGAGVLDTAAVRKVREQLWPDIRDEHELHDLLLSVVALPESFVVRNDAARHWPAFLERLETDARAGRLELAGRTMWVATERLGEVALLWPGSVTATTDRTRDAATTLLVQGWLQLRGPMTAEWLAEETGLHPRSLLQAFVAMEMQGMAMRGVIEHAKPAEDESYKEEWCERRILHRIHRLTLTKMRERVEPVAPQVFMRWLLEWQHVAPGTERTGEEGVLAALEQLEGFEAPAAEWERSLLPQRVAHYDPQWLDALCLAGVAGWGRVSPHPAWAEESAPRRVVPTNAAPVTFFLREGGLWLDACLREKRVEEAVLGQALSAEAQQVRRLLRERGAAFQADIQRVTGLTKQATGLALWELATAGLAAADGFDPLRAMMDPRRKVAHAEVTASSLRRRTAARMTAGRWSLFEVGEDAALPRSLAHASEEQRAAMIARAKRDEAATDSMARVLLRRYGVVFRELLAREANAPKWRDLVPVLRRLEARGEVRGGRFVSGPFGEQFALAEAAESLRAARRRLSAQQDTEAITLAAADPMNLVGVIVPGERTAAVAGKTVALLNGMVVGDATPVVAVRAKRTRSLVEVARADAAQSRKAETSAPPMLF